MEKNVQKLKDDLRKAQNKNKLEYEYYQKLYETQIATQERIYRQERQKLKRDKEQVIELKKRENDVFLKIKSHLQDEIARLQIERNNWDVIVLTNF